MSPDDPLPDLIAQMDQAIAMAPHLAQYARGMYDSFVAVGFSEKQALYMTAAQLHSSPGTAP